MELDFTRLVPPVVKRPVRISEDRVLKAEDHSKLVNHLLNLLERDWENVTERRGHFKAVEMDLLGIVEPLGDDCDVKENRLNGKGVKVPDAIYPFGYLTLQKFTSELMAIVSPIEAPYAVVTAADKQPQANALTKAFRHQSVTFDHRNNIQAVLFEMLSLDCGAMEMKWAKVGRMDEAGPQMKTMAQSERDTVGVKFEHLDPYNIAWDPTVVPSDVQSEGEFFASFSVQTPFRLRREKLRGKCFLDDDIISKLERQCFRARRKGLDYDNDQTLSNTWSQFFYYEPRIAKSRAILHDKYGSRVSKAQTEFTGLFSPIWAEMAEGRLLDAVHVTKFFVRIRPHEWGLTGNLTGRSAREAPFEVWEIHMVGPGYISYAARVEHEIDRLPVVVASMNFGRKFGRSMKFGDHAAQLGLLASTVLNMYKRSMRKGLSGGVTIFNPDVVNLQDVSDMDNGKIPTRQVRFDTDIRQHIMQLNDVPDYKNTINDVGNLVNMLDTMFPTNSQPAVAGLDRATTYQAQAVIMTGMRSLIFYATTVDGQLMVPARTYLQHMNSKFADHLTYVDEQTRTLVEMTKEDLQETAYFLVQSQPMIGIDRLRVTNDLRDMINIMFQSGGQLPPLAGLFLKHWLEASGSLISMDDYQKAVDQTMEQEQQRLAAESGQPAPGGNPPPQPPGPAA